MWRYVLGVAVIAGLFLSALSLSVSAQTPAKGKDADKAKKDAERAAQGYNPVAIIDQAEVRAIRVELKPNANRAIHQHDDVKSHLFIPLSAKLQVTIGSAKPVDAPVGQVFYIKAGTPHGFRNLSSEPGAAIEVFVK
jgi:quercetin dioxygenase-like cupin family protein